MRATSILVNVPFRKFLPFSKTYRIVLEVVGWAIKHCPSAGITRVTPSNNDNIAELLGYDLAHGFLILLKPEESV